MGRTLTPKLKDMPYKVRQATGLSTTLDKRYANFFTAATCCVFVQGLFDKGHRVHLYRSSWLL